jgi:ligand-binding sensor domain-containing protein/signal transduction histidine kinase
MDGPPAGCALRLATELRGNPGFSKRCQLPAMNPVHYSVPGNRDWLQSALLAGVVSVYFLLAGDGFALNPARNILQYNCQTWGRQTGLPVNGISSITQSKDGYLWLGTAVGLIRFDGTEFKVVDMGQLPEARSSGIVNSLSSARDGGIWVGLESSSYGFCDGQTFSFRAREAWEKVDASIRYVRSVHESRDGTLWLGSDNGVLRLTRSGSYEEVIGTSSNALNNAPIIDFLDCNEDREGRMWFGTAAQGAYCWQAGKVTRFPDPSLDGTTVLAMAEDMEGQVWVGTTAGLRCYDTNLVRKDIPPIYPEVRALLADRNGNVWIGTTGQGLALYRNGAYSFLRKTNGLASDFVKCLAEDREGSLWVGTREGISQLTDIKFTTQPASENPEEPDAIGLGASRKGGIWVGNGAGLTYFNGKPKTFGLEAGLAELYVKRVFEASDGDVYLVNGIGKLVVFSGEKAVATYLAPGMVVGLAEDAHGVVASVGGSLYRAGRHYFTPMTFTNGTPGLEWVLNLASGRDGEIWVACNTGVYRVKDGGYRQWGAAEGLADPRAQWLFQDSDGGVWGTTLNGMFRLKDNRIRFITRKNGLFDNNVYSVIPDSFGNLWMDSGRGIFEVKGKVMNDFADGKTSQIECVPFDGPESVKPSDKTTQEHVACKTKDGRNWFPSANGVVEIDPAHIPVNQIPLPVHIDSVRANGAGMFRRTSLVVPPGQGELEIHFSALSFIAPHNIKLRYLLEGYDNGWVEIKDRHVAYYTNLKPGRYKFRVIAANADGIWNEEGDSIEIELRPHYYQTLWFDVLCAGLACAALLGLFAWRVRHLKRKHAESQKARQLLEAEVQNRTAELAKANTSLQQKTLSLELEIEERRRMQQEVERIHRELLETSRMAGMSEIATNVLHNVGNVLNSVNVSATLLTESVKRSKIGNLAKVTALLHEHEHDLGTFITSDPKGRQLPVYLAKLSELLAADQAAAVQELDSLGRNVEHIKEIVAMQQSYAKVAGVKEIVNVSSLVEDSLRMNLGALDRHGVEVIRDFQDVPPINVEKHKILQILINLLRNAKYACDESGRADKRLTVRVAKEDGRLKIAVADNGIGIPRENLNRVFNHGFTTRRNGHGFGLHGGALAARELGGSLTVHSDGPGKGATFTLELPMQPSKNGS